MGQYLLKYHLYHLTKATTHAKANSIINSKWNLRETATKMYQDHTLGITQHWTKGGQHFFLI